jgi:hypothetical protein
MKKPGGKHGFGSGRTRKRATRGSMSCPARTVRNSGTKAFSKLHSAPHPTRITPGGWAQLSNWKSHTLPLTTSLVMSAPCYRMGTTSESLLRLLVPRMSMVRFCPGAVAGAVFLFPLRILPATLSPRLRDLDGNPNRYISAISKLRNHPPLWTERSDQSLCVIHPPAQPSNLRTASRRHHRKNYRGTEQICKTGNPRRRPFPTSQLC